jgi:hypothetical protein
MIHRVHHCPRMMHPGLALPDSSGGMLDFGAEAGALAFTLASTPGHFVFVAVFTVFSGWL